MSVCICVKPCTWQTIAGVCVCVCAGVQDVAARRAQRSFAALTTARTRRCVAWTCTTACGARAHPCASPAAASAPAAEPRYLLLVFSYLSPIYALDFEVTVRQTKKWTQSVLGFIY